MNSKTDKEDRGYDDITFLSEIITNSRYWLQEHNGKNCETVVLSN